jgi:acetyl-CoA carboxylase biotin carboxyl carrier protein
MAKKKPAKPATGESQPDLNQIESLLGFMAEHHLEEFEYSRGDLRIRLKKAGANSASSPASNVSSPGQAVEGASGVLEEIAGTSGSPSSAATTRESSLEAQTKENLHTIKSPIVGTYYESPTPGGAAFVKVGDTVQTGQVLCIIEAMKLMNEIESDVSGEVTGMMAENGQPVEYGQALFTIRPSRKK